MPQTDAMPELIPKFDFDFPTILFLVFCLFAFVQLFFVLFIYARMAFLKPENNRTENIPGISVIIAARNEATNLYNNLPFILEQDYPSFEVIIVNHQSQDDTHYLLSAYKRQYPHLKEIKVEKSVHLKYGKKLPLTIGIKGATYQNLLLTDADCKPASDQWIRQMAARFSDKKEIVLGYGPLEKKKGFLNALIRFDAAWIAMNFFSMAKAGMPYMGVGRNLSYTKSRFDEVSGFKTHYSLPSGDDDLFIQEAATRKNTTICLEPESFMLSSAPETWSGLIRQKSRHFTTASHYKVFKKLMLGIYPFSLLLMLGTFVSLLVNAEFRWLALIIFVVILGVKWIIIGKAFAKLKEKQFIGWMPLLDIFYAIWAPVLYYSVNKSDTKKW